MEEELLKVAAEEAEANAKANADENKTDAKANAKAEQVKVGKAGKAVGEAISGIGDDLRNMKWDYFSDANLKSIYGDIDDKIINDFAKISAIDFSYKPEAQEKYGGNYNIDNDKHTGVIAQELESIESTEAAVSETPEGTKVVDTKELTMADTAAIAELSRRVLALEQVVKELSNK